MKRRHRRTTFQLNDGHHVRVTDGTTADHTLCTDTPCTCPVTLTCTCTWTTDCAHLDAPAAVMRHGKDTNTFHTKATQP